MSGDAKPFAGYEPNTTGGATNLGGDVDLAGAAGRAAKARSVFGGSDINAVSTTVARAGNESSRTLVHN